MLPEVQIVKHDLTAGCSPPSRDIGLRLGTSETLALCRIGKQYAVMADLSRCAAGKCQQRSVSGQVDVIATSKE
jgi:hypothetical protein